MFGHWTFAVAGQMIRKFLLNELQASTGRNYSFKKALNTSFLSIAIICSGLEVGLHLSAVLTL